MSAPPTRSRPCLLDVEQARDETPSVKTLRLRLASDALPFRPGQAVLLSFPDDPETVRAYSIASSPLDEGFLEVSVANAGKFSARLFAARPGERLLAHGTAGKWLYEDHVRDSVLISGGTGITPFRSILRYVLQKQLGGRVRLLHSAREPGEILYRDELRAWAGHPDFSVRVTLTRVDPSRHAWDGPTGRIDLAAVRALVGDLSVPDFYLCGPGALVKSMARALAEQGVRAERLHYETWG